MCVCGVAVGKGDAFNCFVEFTGVCSVVKCVD